ncbi:MAG: pentapeptide repeat-containing protein [Phycisphaerales bacterium]
MAQETKPYWGDEHQPFVKIGTDKQELRALADAVVRGASIAHAEIADLRALIEAVQSHPEVKLGPSKDDQKADRGQDAPTPLVIRGGRIEWCDCSELDIHVPLTTSANFSGLADFREASFSGDAYFGEANYSGDADFGEGSFLGLVYSAAASFSGDAYFGEASFSGNANFRKASFSGDAHFGEASFSGAAHFRGASFSGLAYFGDASFSGDADFGEASFPGPTYSGGASFSGDAYFRGASFSGRAKFGGASFSGLADFRKASFSGLADFGKASFSGLAYFGGASLSGEVDLSRVSFVGDVDLDARWIDVRTARFGDSARRGAIKRWMRRRFGWTVVRGLGELGILTRVSLIALIAVPILAGLWPALRVAVNRYNRAMTEASEQFDQAADRLETAAENTDPELSLTIGEFGAWAHDWRDRFGEMTMDQPQLSWTLALAFFAAVGVTLGQLLYQINAPAKLRKEDEDEFVESIHKRYPEGAPDRNDGLRRATDALAAITRIRGDRHVNFVDHHGETVWIPPGTRIDWFSDFKDEDDVDETVVEADDPDGSQDPKKGRAATREGIIPGAERARIALEEGARAEYWLTGREQPFWSWMSFVFYCVAVLLLFWILIIQSHHVAKAAGWW